MCAGQFVCGLGTVSAEEPPAQPKWPAGSLLCRLLGRPAVASWRVLDGWLAP